MDPESGTTNLTPKPSLRDTERPSTGRRSQTRATSPRTSRGIANRSQKTRPNDVTSFPTQQTVFRIPRIVLFQPQRDDSANSDARVSNPTSRGLPSSKQTSSPVFMHARGTKRSAEADEFELRLEIAPGSNGGINEEGGRTGAAIEAIRSGLPTMAGFLAHTRKLWSWLERSTSNRDDAGDAGVKRVKLSDDDSKEYAGSVHWNGSVNDGANSRYAERKRADRPQKPSTAVGQGRPFPDTEASAVGSFTSSASLAGSYPVDDSLDSAPTIPGTASTIGGRGLDSLRPTRPFAARHPTVTRDPHFKTKLFKERMRLQGAAKPRLSFPVTESRLNNRSSTRLPSDDDSAEPVDDDGTGGKKDSSGHDDASDKEAPRAPAALTVFDTSEGILGTAEAFGGLKISGDVTQREEERERKAKEREEEKRRLEEERQKQAEEQRLREEAKRRAGLREPHKDLFPALTAEWTARVKESLRPGRGNVAETLEAKLQAHDFERLVPSTVWLNDNIVNGTLLWLDRFVNEAAGVTDVKAKTRKCLMPGSFFFTRLLGHGVKGTERTLRRLGVNKDNILDIETILMPICQGNHWTLVVVEPRKRTISHFDSLNPAGCDDKRALAKEWMKTVLGDSFVEEEWRFAKYRAPRQFNGWDCGVHTVLNGVCLGLGIEPSSAYSSDQLPDLRKRIAAILLNQGFKGEFSLAGC